MEEKIEQEEKLQETPTEQEEKVEETPVEKEEKKEEKPAEADVDALLPGPKPIKKYNEEKSYVQAIEEARLNFLKEYNKSRKMSYVMMVVVMAIAIGAVVCITLNNQVAKIIGWVLVGVAVVGMLVFYIATKNKLPHLTKDYIQVVNEVMNGHNYSDNTISEPMTDEKEKAEMADLMVDGVYANLGNIASRNMIHAKYRGHKFIVGDIGLYDNGQGKKRASLFVGKYLSMNNELHFKGHYIINIKNPQRPLDLPTDIEDLAVLVNEEDFVIYGPKDGDVKKDLGSKFLPAVRKIALNETLLNVNFVIWAGHSAAYLSYSDDIMTLPFQNPFTGKENDKYRKDLYDSLEAFNVINK
ncbi:MAG: hypothetical protein K6F07_03445 [Bacilli bacterium]|nr:hypothetical protein [Bacilli bacterium]